MSAKVTAKRLLSSLGLMEPARRIAREIHTLRQDRLTEDQIAEIYRAQYHERAGYGAEQPEVQGDWESDDVIKLEHAKAILSVLPLKKVLVGGCSSGMALVAFRKLGVEAHGFEISPDLDRIVLPEVRSHVRQGRMERIPFGPDDRFDALVTTDVLEHVQLRMIDAMMTECARLGTPWMAHLINHTAMTPDHMTLKPIAWWEKRWARHGYKLRRDIVAPRHANPRLYGLNGDPDHVYTFWERQ